MISVTVRSSKKRHNKVGIGGSYTEYQYFVDSCRLCKGCSQAVERSQCQVDSLGCAEGVVSETQAQKRKGESLARRLSKTIF